MALTENVLEIRNLVKDFPSVRAVNDVSFDVKRNTVHCLVGENGAGKSTLIKILTTLLAPTSGWARVAGYDTPYPHAQEWDYFPGPKRVGEALQAVMEA